MQTIQPVKVERDSNGYWTHPDLPDLGETYEVYLAWFAANGLQVRARCLEDEEENHPAYISYYQEYSPDISQWQPEAPEGDGWFLFSIHDTDDGPYAWFVRPVMGETA